MSVESLIKPQISIVLPTHNSERYVRKTIDSLRGQSFSNYELIIVDSSTEDETSEILKEYSTFDKRIRLIDDSNGSYGHKINVGIDKAKAEFFVIVESDDIVEKRYLEKLYQAINKDNLDFVKCDFAYFSEGEKLYFTEQHHCTQENYNRTINLKDEIEFRRTATNHIWTGIYRTAFLRKHDIRLNESAGASYQDTGFSVLCNLYANKISFIEDVLYFYRQDNEDSSVKDEKKYMCVVEEFDWIYRQLSARKLMDEECLAYVEMCKKDAFIWNANRLNATYRNLFFVNLTNKGVDPGFINIIRANVRETDPLNMNKTQLIFLLQALLANKKIIIWGYNKIGRFIQKVDCDFGINHVVKMCDSDEKKRNDNALIYSPDQVIKEYVDAYYIIAARKSGSDMKRQLLDNGIMESQVMVIDKNIYTFDYELLNREELAQIMAKAIAEVFV